MNPVARLINSQVAGFILLVPVLIISYFSMDQHTPSIETICMSSAIFLTYAWIAAVRKPNEVFAGMRRLGINTSASRCLISVAALFALSLSVSAWPNIGRIIAFVIFLVAVLLYGYAVFLATFRYTDEAN